MKKTFIIIPVIALVLSLLALSLLSVSVFAGENAKLNNKPQVKTGSNASSSTTSNAIMYPYFLERNPFQTFLYTKKPAVSFKVGEIPLLQYSLSSLKIVGIMQRRGDYFAMLQTPDNRSYIITVGSVIGVDRARVVSIGSNYINLTENTYNALGQIRSINLIMKMK